MAIRNKTVKHFASLSVSDIRDQLLGHWNEMNLLDVAQHFRDEKEYKHAAATWELLLHSPELSKDLAYSELYFELYELLRWRGDYAGSLRWLHAAIMFDEQHEKGASRANLHRDLAETYLRAGDLDTGFAITTRSLLNNPQDVWIHNALAVCLSDLGLDSLAVELLERGLAITRQDDSEGLKEQFEKLLQESRDKAAQEMSRLSEISPDVLQTFRSALHVEQQSEPDGISHSVLANGLATADEDEYRAAAAEIFAQGKVLAPELIRIACDQSLTDTPAIGRAIALLRQLHASNTVELGELANWLERADGDWHSTLYSTKIGKVGGLTNEELEAITLDTQYNVYLRNNAVDALIERMQHDAALSERVVALLRRLLTRPEAYDSAKEETFLGFLITTIGEHKIKELYPEIEAAFREDRVDPQITDLALVQEDFDMVVTDKREVPREDSFNLLLKCKSCGRERRHFVEYVTIDTGTLERQQAGHSVQYDPHVMDREIVCPKCGARDQYELSPMAALQLLMPADGSDRLALLLGNRKSKPKPNPRVRRIQSVIMERPMHPLEGIERYEKRIAASPQDAENYVRMGNILRVIHRDRPALEAFRKGYELDPSDPDCIMAYAMAEHDFGDRLQALNLYQETLELLMKNPVPDPYLLDVAAIAREGLQALKEDQASHWAIENTPAPASPEPPQQRASKPKRPKRQKNKSNKPKAKKKRKRNQRK